MVKANCVEVRVVSPIVTRGFRKVSDLKALEYPGVTVSHAEIKTGPGSIESEFEAAVSVESRKICGALHATAV